MKRFLLSLMVAGGLALMVSPPSERHGCLRLDGRETLRR